MTKNEPTDLVIHSDDTNHVIGVLWIVYADTQEPVTPDEIQSDEKRLSINEIGKGLEIAVNAGYAVEKESGYVPVPQMEEYDE